MHIVFVHTPIPLRTVENRGAYWSSFDRRYLAAHPNVRPMRRILWELPHWIPWLAGVLREAGFASLEALELYGDCALIDRVDMSRIEARLRDCPGDVFLFSPMTINLPESLEIAGLVKAQYPDAVTIFGGIVATPLHREVAAHPHVDWVVRDRGEYALPALLRSLSSTNIEDIPNLTWADASGDVHVVPRLYPYAQPSDIAFPEVEIFDAGTGQDLRYIRQNYALGCPFTCAFCTIQTINRKPIYFPIDRVLHEIAAYRKHYGNHHHVYFGDETFTLNVPRTLELCAAFAARGGLRFDCQTRVNCLRDARLPSALSSAGCRWLEIGLESANEDTQTSFKQRTKLGGFEDTLYRLRDAGLPTCTYLIVGLPNETTTAMKKSVDYVCSLIDRDLLYASYISIFVPYPGTPMFERPADYGMTLHHKHYQLYSEELPPAFDGVHASSDEIYEIFVEGLAMLASAMGGRPFLQWPLEDDYAPAAVRDVRYGEFYRGG